MWECVGLMYMHGYMVKEEAEGVLMGTAYI